MLVLCLLICALTGCKKKAASQGLAEARVEQLESWLNENGQTPQEYVLGKFKDHDVVILGEPHRLRDHPLLVQDLIVKLGENGVHILATEFARAVDQPLIDSLLNSPQWNEELGREIQMRQYSLWPWREYLDIFKVAWQYNQSLAQGQGRFRIIGVNCDPDWSVIQTVEDMDNPAKRREAWKGCTEADWANVVLPELTAGKKVLAYCGMHHAFSRYKQPRVNEEGEFMGWGDVRFGNHLRDSLGDRVFTIALHTPWYAKTSQYNTMTLRPVEGAIDQVMESREGGARPVGFDMLGSPFGELTDTLAIYAVGYPNFTLSEYCDGYIYFRPFAQSEVVTFIEGYYNDSTIAIARVSATHPWYRTASPQDFEDQMKKQVIADRKRLKEL